MMTVEKSCEWTQQIFLTCWKNLTTNYKNVVVRCPLPTTNVLLFATTINNNQINKVVVVSCYNIILPNSAMCMKC